MGATGKYKIEYQIAREKLRKDLGEVESLIAQHSRAINQTSATGIQTPTYNKQEVAAINAATRARNADTAALKAQTQAQDSANASSKTGAKDTQTLTGQLGNLQLALSRMVLWWGSAAVIMGGKQLISTIQEVAGNYQYAVRELAVMGDEGEATYKRLASSSFDWAADTARSFEEANQAMQEWLRQGYNSVEIAELTRNTLIGLNLAQMSTGALVKTLTAEMRAYNIPASESISIIDKLVGVERKYAVSSEELAVGLRKFASVANEANVTLDQQIGLMTAMIVRTQQAPESVGTAARTMLIRLTGVGAKVVETMGKVNIYADEQNRTFRSSWDILSELASKWNTYDDVQKKQIATAVAGVRQQEFFIALMKDFDLALEANIISIGSAGLAYRANMQLMDTYKGAVGALKAEWDKLLSSQSGILSLFTNIAKGSREIVQWLQQIPKELAYIGPAVVTVLGGLLTKINPILGIITMLAGAFTGLTAIIGATTINTDDMFRKLKDLGEARYLEAKSTEELAKEYIRLYQEQDGVNKHSKSLIAAREQLNKLMPILLGGEQDLVKIYDILIDKVDTLDTRTQILAETRERTAQAQLQQQRAQAIYELSQLQTGSGNVKLKFSGQRDINTQLRVLENYRGQIENEMLSKLREPTAEELKRAGSAFGIVTGQKITTNPLDMIRAAVSKQAKEQLVYQFAKEGLAGEANELNKTLDNVYKIKDLLLTIQMSNLGLQLEPSAPTGGDTTTPSVERDLENKIKAAQLQVTLEYYQGLSNLESDIVTKTEQDKILKQKIFDVTKATYEYELKHLAVEEDENDVKKRYNEFLDGGVEKLQLQVDLEQARLVIADATIKAEERRQQLLDANLQKQKNIQEQIRSEAIEQQKGPVAGLEYRLQKALEDLNKAFIEDIATNVLSPNKSATQARYYTARSLVDELRLKLEQENTKEIERQIKAEDVLKDKRIELNRLLTVGERTGADAALDVLNVRVKDLEALKAEGAQQILIDAAAKDEAEAKISLARELLKERQATLDLDKKIKDTETEGQLEVLKLTNGEYAAALKLVAIREEELKIAKEAKDVNKEKEAQIRLLESQNNLEKTHLDLLKQEKEFWGKIQQSAQESRFQGRLRTIQSFQGEGEALRQERLKSIKDAQRAGERMGQATPETREQRQKEFQNSLLAIQAINQKRTDYEDAQRERRKELDKSMNDVYEQGEYDRIELTQGRLAMLDQEINDTNLLRNAERDITKQKEYDLQITSLVVERNKEAMQVERQRYVALIEYASSLAVNAIGATVGGGKFNWGGAISGGAGLIASLGFAANPVLGAGIAAGGAIIGALVDNATSQDKNTEVINMNTVAIDRNTQMLNDVFARAINIPTSFLMPAALSHFGNIPSAANGGYVERGGLVNVHAGESIGGVGNLTININGANQTPDQIANKVMYAIERKWNIQARSGGNQGLLAN